MTRTLQRALEEQKRSTQQETLRFTGILGIPLSGSRVIEVPNRKGYVYVRLRDNPNEVIQAFNNQVAPSYNLPVIVERISNKYIISGVDTERYENNWNSYSPYLPRHGNTHSFDIESGGGGDIVWVYPRQFMPLLVLPSGSLGAPNVIVAPYTLRKDNNSWLYTGNTGTQSFAPYRPTSPTGAIMGLVYLNTDDGNPYIFINSGTVFSNSITGSSQVFSYIPQITSPSTQIPLAAIRLITGTNQISWDNIYDVRQFLHNTPTGTGGGSASINTGTLDARYLKLDASNDPVTGDLQVNARLVAVGKAGEISGNLLLAQQFDYQYLAGNIEHRLSGSVTAQDSTFLVRRTVDPTSNAYFPFASLDLWDSYTSGGIYGGALSARMNNTQRLLLNPYATGTNINYLFDTDKVRPTGTIHTSWRVSGTTQAYLDVSGTFYSNGQPLIKEAPIDGLLYARRNAGWDILKSETSILSAGQNLTGSNGVYQKITGFSVTLPSAGTYNLDAVVRGVFQDSAAGGYITAKLYNSTDAADVANSNTLVLYAAVLGTYQTTVPIMTTVTVTGSKVIELYAARTVGGTPTAMLIDSNSDGRTSLRYTKVG